DEVVLDRTGRRTSVAVYVRAIVAALAGIDDTVTTGVHVDPEVEGRRGRRVAPALEDDVHRLRRGGGVEDAGGLSRVGARNTLRTSATLARREDVHHCVESTELPHVNGFERCER